MQREEILGIRQRSRSVKCLTSALQIQIIKMKVQYIALLGLLPIAVSAQGPTLEHARNTPAVGATYHVHRNSQFTPPGNAGAGASWEHSALVADSQVVYNVLDVATFEFAAGYPTSTHLLSDGDDTLIYRADMDGIVLMGEDITYEFQPLLPPTDVHTAFSDGPMILKYPSSFGTTWQDPVSATYELETIGTMTRSGQIMGNVDAEGSLELPNGAYSDVLRVYTHYDVTEAGGVINGTRNTHTYSFYSDWLRHPLLRIMADTISVFGSNSITYRTEWLDEASVGLVEAIEQGEAFGLWPTPATDVLNITIPEGHAGRKSGILRDVTGRVVREWQIGAIGNSTFNVSDLPDGQYFLQVIGTGGELGVRKVIIR